MVIMVVKPSSSELKYKITRKAGKNITEQPPVFSPDGQFVLIIVKNVVRVYSIVTGDCVRTLETEKTVNELVSVQFCDVDKFNLYGCSSNGLVIVWTWANGAVLREIDLQLPPERNVASFNLINKNECLVIAEGDKQTYYHLASYLIKNGTPSLEYLCSKIPVTKLLCVSIGICDGDKYAAISNGTKIFYIQNLVQPHLKTKIINHNQLRVISISAHPTDGAVAITDTLGRVTIIRGYLYHYANLAKEQKHWHHLPVLASCFSCEGSYLYTGGIEKVLVKWTMGSLANRAEEKKFIPRLPGTVKYISANSSHVAISLTNNMVVIATVQMKVTTTIMECGGLSPVCRSIGPSLVYHSSTGSLLLGGRTGHLQLYSTASDKLLYSLDITNQNNIPPSRQILLPLDIEVTCAAVSANGSWLVTSEYRNDNITYPEERMKFWMATQRQTAPFHVNTCVNLSHGGFQVVSLAMSSTGDFCVSAGKDRKFRIWKLDTSTEDTKTVYSWSCLTACYYSSGFDHSSHYMLDKFKNSNFNKADKIDSTLYMTEFDQDDVVSKIIKNEGSFVMNEVESSMGGVAISQDGSLIAAWFDSKLTLWDTHQSTLTTCLSHPILRSKGLQVEFGKNDAAHYLICTTENCLAVWSLLSLTIKWYVNIRPSCLAADPFTNKLAVITQENDVFIFSPHSPSALLKREKVIEPRTGVFTKCTFSTSSKDTVRLYMMRNDSEIYCFEPEHSEDVRLEAISKRNLPQSNFSALLAEQYTSEVTALKPTSLDYLDTDRLGKTAISQFMSSASHMMPPVSLLCTTFLEHIAGRQEIQITELDTEEPMELEPESSDEDEPKTVSSCKKTELWTPNYEQIKEKRLKKVFDDKSLNVQLTKSLLE